MPHCIIEMLPKNSVKLTITVPQSEIAPFLESSATRLSEQTTIDGFRAGKAPYEMIKNKFGEMKILENAIEDIVRSSLFSSLEKEKLETIGSPAVDVEKLAPGNDLVYTAMFSLIPKIEKLANYKEFSIKPKTVVVSDEEVEAALKTISQMQTKETREDKSREITKADKAIISMNIKKEGIPIEGGQSPNHAVYLSENFYIPGFVDALIGMKEGENKTFPITFPKDFYKKDLCGADVLCEVEIKEVYSLLPPELDDSFAASLGQKDMSSLRAIIKENLLKEHTEESAMETEREIVEKLANESRINEIPELLLNEELNKMINELKQRVHSQGLEWEAYVSSIKKSVAEIKLDLSSQAAVRIKAALALAEVAKQENITVTEDELDNEIDQILNRYPKDAEEKKYISSIEYRDMVRHGLTHRKTIQRLKEICIKS
ncbi:MAG: Trigger factor [uncultured bacterium]|nr:MAG: Trigger factor [uncultured bacterium]HBD05755.1 trigger factor [Candidatus Uhrbacteria bacterium]